MKINMDFADIDVAVDNLEEAADAIRDGCVKGINDGLRKVIDDALPKINNVTGQLKNSFELRAAKATASGAEGSVHADGGHALFVEMGTGARGAASGGDDKAPGGAYTIEWPGMAARPFLYPAYKANQGKIVSCVADAIGEALGR